MEGGGSFPLKSRKLLIFAVSSSFLSCFLFYYCVLNIGTLVPRRTHFQSSRCNKSNAASFGGTLLFETANISQRTFDSTLPEKVVLSNISVEENRDVSGDFPYLTSGEEQVRGNGSSLEVAESVSRTDAAKLGISDWKNDFKNLQGNENSNTSEIAVLNHKKIKDLDANKINREVERECDVYDGKWVFDESYPLYDGKSCLFIDEGFSCEANGRTDRDYMKWRWKPNHCDIPRFNPVKMLESIKGKRLVFVGDSINRNQWESMMCILLQAVSDPKHIYEARGRKITKEKGQYSFKFVDYNCSVEYYVTHFLVHESKARINTKRTKTLRIDTVDRGASKWRGADILVFNTAHWWSHHKTKSGVNYYQEGNLVYPHLDVSTAFHKSLKTWARWVDQYVNPAKTQVFFRSSSPSHYSGGEWNTGGHCKESKHPLNFSFRKRVPIPEMNLVVQQVLDQMTTPVTVLNITNLSGLRIDGHPSIYGRKPVNGAHPSGIQDCSHWCLPGVPDTWNELLYYHIISSQKSIVKR